MKRFAIALVLACALSGTALAGYVPSTGAPAPQPPGDVPSTGAPGDIPSTGSPSPGDVPSVGVSVVLTILDLMF